MSRCPAPEQLRALLADQVGGPETEALENHVESCSACQQALEELTRAASRAPPAPVRIGAGKDFLRRLEQGPPTHVWRAAEPEAAGASPSWTAATNALVFPGYQVLSELGRGAMGVVYKAWQTNLSRVVALKTLQAGPSSNSDELARLKVEAEAVARLEHPHIVRIYEVGEAGGRPYLALEYVDGGSLEQKLRGAPQPAEPTARLLEKLARAIHHAHEQGVIHRDLKPSNILLDGNGAPKVSDFGLAKLTCGGDGATLSGMILGTASYMAPEQAQGKVREVGAAADVYALGALLYEMLTGRPPFRGESVHDTLLQVVADDPVPPRRLQPRVSRDLETICLFCLRKEPGRRYASAAELADDLKRFLEGGAIRARQVGAVERGIKWSRRRPAVAALSLAILLLSAFGFTLVSWQWARASAERRNALERAEAETAAHHRAQRLAALLALDRGISLCELGEAGRGFLWLAHSLGLAPADADDVRHACRANLGAWAPHVYPIEVYRRQPGKGQHVAFRPDGKAVLTGGLHGSSELWSPASGELIARVEQGGPVYAVAFSPDSKLLALAVGPDHSERLAVYDAHSGQFLRLLEGHCGMVRAIAFSADSGTILTGGEDCTARLWDACTGESRGKCLSHPAPVIAAAFRPHSGEFATGCEDHKVRFWDCATGELRRVPIEQGDAVTALAFHPNGNVLLSGCWDGAAQRWDAATGKRLGPPLQHASKVLAVDFSPDGRTLLTGSYDHTARLWDAVTSKPIGAPLLHQYGVMSAAFSPDGQTVLTGCWGDTARLWRVSPHPLGRIVLPHPRDVEAVAFSPDGKTIVTGCADRKARVWDAVSGKGRGAPLLTTGAIRAVAFSFDGEVLATASTRLPGPTTSITRSRSSASQLQLWRAGAFRPFGPPLTQAGGVSSIAFSPDSKRLLAGSRNGTVRLWDLDARRSRALAGHAGEVRAAAFSPDGLAMLTASTDTTARLWDVAQGKTLAVFEHQDLVVAAAFSPDSKTLLTGSYNGTAQLWDAQTHQRRGKPLEHQAYVYAVAFSPDGRTILTGSEDQTARLWDAATGRPIGPPLRHDGPVPAAVFCPDGRRIATSGGKAAYLWPVLAPIESDPGWLRLWVEVRTGLELDAEEGVRLLSPTEWQDRRRRLETASNNLTPAAALDSPSE